MAITKYSMLTKGQRRRLAAFRRRRATMKKRSAVRVKMAPPNLSKTLRTAARYAAGANVAKRLAPLMYTKSTGTRRAPKMVMNNGMAGSRTAGTRTSTRLAGAAPEFGGLANKTRKQVYTGPKVSEANINNIIARLSGMRTTNY